MSTAIRIMLGLGLVFVACRQPPATPTPAATRQPAATVLATARPTDSAPPPTMPPTETATAPPMATATTAAPIPTATPPPATATRPPTATATPTPAGPAALVAGEVLSRTLAPGGVDVFRYDAPARFEQAVIMVEPAGAMDAVIRVYDQEVTGANLADRPPLDEGDQSPAGDREIMVFTLPRVATYFIVVSDAAGVGGDYAFYLLDQTVGAPPAFLAQADALAAGEVKGYAVPAAGSRAILAYVNPDGQSDLRLEIVNAAGAVVNEGNFSGAGSAEALFILPRLDQTYTVRVSEVSGAASSYGIIIVRFD